MTHELNHVGALAISRAREVIRTFAVSGEVAKNVLCLLLFISHILSFFMDLNTKTKVLFKGVGFW